jgi:hypothetical protein
VWAKLAGREILRGSKECNQILWSILPGCISKAVKKYESEDMERDLAESAERRRLAEQQIRAQQLAAQQQQQRQGDGFSC